MNFGYQSTQPGSVYPSSSHPEGYFFQWENGRVLQEHQLVFISCGTGIFESETTVKTSVKAGSIILLYPGKWHRYKPDQDKGWVEYFVGIEGVYVEEIFDSFKVSGQDYFEFEAFSDIHNLFIQMAAVAVSGWDKSIPLLKGIIAHILGLVQNKLINEKGFFSETENAVSRSIVYMQEHIQSSIDMLELSMKFNMGYSLFRKKFKEITGVSPAQYFIQMKLVRAKKMLSETALSSKEIAFRCGFESEHYFNRLFKMKNNITPGQFRIMAKQSKKQSN